MICTKILEINLFAFAKANKLTSNIFVYKNSPLVIPEYIWVIYAYGLYYCGVFARVYGRFFQ